MKESDVMQGLSANQQAEILVNSIMKEIEKLNALPAEEAKRVALTNLFDAGIIDEDGNYTAPYVALGDKMEITKNCIEALRAVLYKHYPASMFSFDGYAEDALCMEEEDGMWHIYQMERGIRNQEEIVPTVLDACMTMIKKVVTQPADINNLVYEFLSEYKKTA